MNLNFVDQNKLNNFQFNLINLIELLNLRCHFVNQSLDQG